MSKEACKRDLPVSPKKTYLTENNSAKETAHMKRNVIEKIAKKTYLYVQRDLST